MLHFLDTESMIKKEDEKILRYKDLTIEIQGMWNVKEKVIPVIIDWNHFKIAQTIPEQRTGKARNLGTAKKQPYWAPHTYCWKC